MELAVRTREAYFEITIIRGAGHHTKDPSRVISYGKSVRPHKTVASRDDRATSL